MKFTLNELIRIALLLAVAIIIHFIEAFFIIPIGGFHLKIGLSNIVILLVLFRMNIWMVLFFAICKSCFSFIYEPAFNSLTWFISVGGSFFSITSMLLIKSRFKNNIQLISVIGGIFHNIGQILAILLFFSNLFYNLFIFYLPFLIITGAIAGFLTGKITEWVLNRTDKSVLFGNKV